MLLNLLVALLVFLVAGYLGNQGVLSALLGLIAASFGAILAGGLFESLQHFIGGYRPEYARGFTFILLFIVGFAVARFAADFAIPENIKLPSHLNRVIGGVFGLCAGLVIVGSLLIGAQMLPLSTSILGYDRFGTDNGMQGEGPGAIATGSNIWLAPDRFTLAIINAATGRSLGGDHNFATVHPDLLTEAYGYRNTVQPGVTTALPPELMKVDLAWASHEPAILSAFQITDATKQAAVVRVEITSATEPPKNSVNAAASGSFFFVTPSNVRLVTNQGRQYYPVGYLEKGRQFTPTPLDAGQVADDFSSGKTTAAEDWVFAINSDEKPKFIEIKQLARVALDTVQDKPAMPLASNEYPPRVYRQDQGSFHITAAGFTNAHIESVTVYVINPNTTIKAVKSIYEGPYANITSALQQINSSEGEWYKATLANTAGVPSRGELDGAHRVLQDYMNKPPEENLTWDVFLHYTFPGRATTDPSHNMIEMPRYFQDTLVPYFVPPVLLKKGTFDAAGKLDLDELPKGTLDVITAIKTDTGFYFWDLSRAVKPKTATDVALSPDNATFKLTLK